MFIVVISCLTWEWNRDLKRFAFKFCIYYDFEVVIMFESVLNQSLVCGKDDVIL